jgi:hypothetical protein
MKVRIPAILAGQTGKTLHIPQAFAADKFATLRNRDAMRSFSVYPPSVRIELTMTWGDINGTQ